jgi:hypothetical protein
MEEARNCPHCGRPIHQGSASDYVLVHLWGRCVMHWRCCVALMKDREVNRKAGAG